MTAPGPSEPSAPSEPSGPSALSGRGALAGIVAALLAACVAFQLNASMLSPALVTMARELGTD